MHCMKIIVHRSDLEEVRKQFGLDGNISDILEQFGATSTGKISFTQFSENGQVLFGDSYTNSSESSPEYCSTDSEANTTTNITDRGASNTKLNIPGGAPDTVRNTQQPPISVNTSKTFESRNTTTVTQTPNTTSPTFLMASHDKSNRKKDDFRKGRSLFYLEIYSIWSKAIYWKNLTQRSKSRGAPRYSCLLDPLVILFTKGKLTSSNYDLYRVTTDWVDWLIDWLIFATQSHNMNLIIWKIASPPGSW